MSSTWHYRRKALVQFLRANKAVPAGAVVIAAIMIFLAAKGNGWGSNHGLLSDSLLTVATLIVTYLIVDVVIKLREERSEMARERAVISSIMFSVEELLDKTGVVRVDTKGPWKAVHNLDWSETELAEPVHAIVEHSEVPERQVNSSLLHAQSLRSLDSVRILTHIEECLRGAFAALRNETLIPIDRVVKFHLMLLQAQTWLWLWRNAAESDPAAYVLRRLLDKADAKVDGVLDDWKASVESVTSVIGFVEDGQNKADKALSTVSISFLLEPIEEFEKMECDDSDMTDIHQAVAAIQCEDDQVRGSFADRRQDLQWLIGQRTKRYDPGCENPIDFREFNLNSEYDVTCLREDSVFRSADVTAVEFAGVMPADPDMFRQATTRGAKFDGKDLTKLLDKLRKNSGQAEGE